MQDPKCALGTFVAAGGRGAAGARCHVRHTGSWRASALGDEMIPRTSLVATISSSPDISPAAPGEAGTHGGAGQKSQRREERKGPIQR